MRMITEADHDALIAKAAECDRLQCLINTPELHDFARAVVLEAGHQRQRWGSDHDAGKGPADWFWLVGHLGTRALEHHKEAERTAALFLPGEAAAQLYEPQLAHHREKAVHHTITAAAVLANWHAFVLGKTNMRPGIDPAQHGITT